MNSCSNKVMIRRSLDLIISMLEKNYIHTKRDPPLCLCSHMVAITVCCLAGWISFSSEWRSMQRHRSWCLQSSSTIWDALKYPAWPPPGAPGLSCKSSSTWISSLGWGGSNGMRHGCVSNWIKPISRQNDKCLPKGWSFGHSFCPNQGSI